jgi:hypothetical protein
MVPPIASPNEGMIDPRLRGASDINCLAELVQLPMFCRARVSARLPLGFLVWEVGSAGLDVLRLYCGYMASVDIRLNYEHFTPGVPG